MRGPSARSVRHVLLTDTIHQIHDASNGVYGVRRVHAELTLGRGMKLWHGTVAMLMSRAGLKGIVGRPKWRRARPDLLSADLVDRRFARQGLDQLWVTDITEHPTREGKVYCAVVLDVCSRRVVGWAIDSSPTAALTTNALGMAIDNREPRPGTVIHSDHGVQFGPGPSPGGPGSPGWCPRWARSGTVTTMPSSSRSGRACRSSCWIGAGDGPGWSWPTRSSSTWRSSITGNGGTRRSAG
jgi:hypothetical protein